MAHLLIMYLAINNIDRSSNNLAISDVLTRLFTSMFIHSGIAHLAFNVSALGYLGGYAERSVGIPRYLLIYILAGIAGALFHSVIASYILGSGHNIYRCIRSNFGSFGIAAVSGECKSILLAHTTNCICYFRFFCSVPTAFTAHIGGFIANMSHKIVHRNRTKETSKYLRPPGDNT